MDSRGQPCRFAGRLMTLIPACISLVVAFKFMKLAAPLGLGAVVGQAVLDPGHPGDPGRRGQHHAADLVHDRLRTVQHRPAPDGPRGRRDVPRHHRRLTRSLRRPPSRLRANPVIVAVTGSRPRGCDSHGVEPGPPPWTVRGPRHLTAAPGRPQGPSPLDRRRLPGPCRAGAAPKARLPRKFGTWRKLWGQIRRLSFRQVPMFRQKLNRHTGHMLIYSQKSGK